MTAAGDDAPAPADPDPGARRPGPPPWEPGYGDRVEIHGWDLPGEPSWDGPALVLAPAEDGVVEVAVPSRVDPRTGAPVPPRIGLFATQHVRPAPGRTPGPTPSWHARQHERHSSGERS